MTSAGWIFFITSASVITALTVYSYWKILTKK